MKDTTQGKTDIMKLLNITAIMHFKKQLKTD